MYAKNYLMKNNVTTIAFDADDTLWANEQYFQQAEMDFCNLLAVYLPRPEISAKLLETEIKNLDLYGYGIKGFTLSMIETLSNISNTALTSSLVNAVIKIGHDLLQKPVKILPGVHATLDGLKDKFKLIVATKGDLMDQERKLDQSGIGDYFHHVEVMSEKRVYNYRKLLTRIKCEPNNFLMLGNSLKSDILPVLEIGGYAAHIPYDVTWVHEQHDENLAHERFLELNQIEHLLYHLI